MVSTQTKFVKELVIRFGNRKIEASKNWDDLSLQNKWTSMVCSLIETISQQIPVILKISRASQLRNVNERRGKDWKRRANRTRNHKHQNKQYCFWGCCCKISIKIGKRFPWLLFADTVITETIISTSATPLDSHAPISFLFISILTEGRQIPLLARSPSLSWLQFPLYKSYTCQKHTYWCDCFWLSCLRFIDLWSLDQTTNQFDRFFKKIERVYCSKSKVSFKTLYTICNDRSLGKNQKIKHSKQLAFKFFMLGLRWIIKFQIK